MGARFLSQCVSNKTPRGRMSPMLGLRAVNHITLIISDVEKSREFYVGLLGLTELNRPPSSKNPGAWLDMGNVQLHLVQGAHAHIEAAHSTNPDHMMNHIAFETGNFDRSKSRLEALGREFKYVKVVKAAGMVMRQIFLPDPDGHFIEICDCKPLTEFVYGNLQDSLQSAVRPTVSG